MNEPINSYMNLFYGDEETLKKTPVKQNHHGKIVERRCEAYQDVIIYEDGHCEYFYIGD